MTSAVVRGVMAHPSERCARTPQSLHVTAGRGGPPHEKPVAVGVRCLAGGRVGVHAPAYVCVRVFHGHHGLTDRRAVRYVCLVP